MPGARRDTALTADTSDDIAAKIIQAEQRT
jgi:hypothetical protein